MIRKATVDDIKPIYDMIEAYHTEAMNRLGLTLKWDKEKAVIQLGNWLWNQEFSINLIADHGVFLGEVQETWFGGDRFGKPHVLYVSPQHRNGLLARAFMRRFDAECLNLGAVGAVWDNWAGITDRSMLNSLMNYFGYRSRGDVYSKLFIGDSHGSVDTHIN